VANDDIVGGMEFAAWDACRCQGRGDAGSEDPVLHAVRSGARAQAIVSASSRIRPTSATPRQKTRMLVTIREKIAGGKSGPAMP
jgi:hypothetical protein